MLNYDFRNLLSAYEFECFTRDIINAHEGLDLGSFAEGRDGGIDLRYTSDDGETIIVQAKRYKDYNDLIAVLKKEVDKVNKLNPNRYIISTSVDLTANNKQCIIDLFHPFIKSENDILGKQDLNKLLALHPDIERQYYKLWLASTEVLNTIINKDICNWSEFELNEIKDTVKTYVMNDSFDDALKKLKENRYVVISGEPGIGKTTLARMLVWYLLSDKFDDNQVFGHYDEFYSTFNNINDYAKVLNKGKRQIFYYDDFLGQISLEAGEKNFEKGLLTFISACQKSDDKLLILTTREYVLQQGLIHYPTLKSRFGVEFSKCIVDLSKYSRFVRAQMLYNHLIANDIPQPYINSLLIDKNYLKIIDHPNFSPRIIEAFTETGVHKDCEPDKYIHKVISFFDYPDKVWLDAFKRFDRDKQEALLILTTMDPPVFLSDWKEAFGFFYDRVHKNYGYINDHDWDDIVKTLHNSFIKTKKTHEGICVSLHNPGIKDVILRYLEADDNQKIVLLDNSLFIEQFFGVFEKCDVYFFLRRNRPYTIPEDLYDSITNAFDSCWNNYKSCRIEESDPFNIGWYLVKKPLLRTRVIHKFEQNFKQLLIKKPGYLEKKITESLLTDENEDLESQLFLLDKVDLTSGMYNLDKMFDNYCRRVSTLNECMAFVRAVDIYFKNRIDYIYSQEFNQFVNKLLSMEFKYCKGLSIYSLFTDADVLCDYIPDLINSPIIKDINKTFNEYIDNQNLIEEELDEVEDEDDSDDSREIENKAIDNLFGSI